MRTDSVNLSQEAINGAKDSIEKLFGKQYVKTRQFKNKSKSAQEAHEAIRPTNFMDQSIGNSSENSLYELIWKRTIASQMSEAQIERTIATIGISTTPETLTSQGEVKNLTDF